MRQSAVFSDRRKVMNRIKHGVSLFAFAAIALVSLAIQADGQRLSTKDKRDIVRILNSRIDGFQNRLSYQLESSSADRNMADDVMTDLQNLQRQVRGFDQDIVARRDNRDTMNDILDSAKGVNAFMAENRQYRGLEADWNGIRSQLNRLSSSYGVTPDWGYRGISDPDAGYPSQPVSRGPSSPLTGTYRIDIARSERISDVLAGSRVGAAQRQELEDKLEAPEEIAIDVSGDQVTLASSKASPVTVTADGRDKTETANGRTVRVRSTLRGDRLTVSSVGGENDYTITFEPQQGGRIMKVTRRITTDYLRETIFAESVYNRTSSVAGLGIRGNTDDAYSSNDPNDDPYTRNPRPANTGNRNPTSSRPRVGEFIVPDGTVVTGRLETDVDTKVSQNNDRFRMTVESPNEYRGAVIEGYLSGIDRSNRVFGRSTVTFNFERITMPDGRAYDFAGSLQQVTDQTGKIIAVDNEGSAQGDNKTRDTATRGGIGAGIGAILGAIIGGGKGAAIGAIIGGGAGAGSVALEGRGDIQLLKGSTIAVRSSSPIR